MSARVLVVATLDVRDHYAAPSDRIAAQVFDALRKAGFDVVRVHAEPLAGIARAASSAADKTAEREQ